MSELLRVAAPIPLLGIAAKDPRDGAKAFGAANNSPQHQLADSLGATYARMSVDVAWLDGAPENSLWKTGYEFYDEMYELNRGYQIILLISGLVLERIPTLGREIICRYKVWGLDTLSENGGFADLAQDDAAIIDAYARAWAKVVATLPSERRPKLIGPSRCNNWNPSLWDKLRARGTFSVWNVIANHYYEHCWGNGSIPAGGWPTTGSPKSPADVVDGWPNMARQLDKLRAYAGPKPVMLEEIGVPQGDPAAAVMAAWIARVRNVPLVLAPSLAPLNNSPYSNAIYDQDRARWSEAMIQFRNALVV